ncbi:MAG: PilZ domain-containing protein, partial [Pseudomonadota bacterium]
SSQLLTGEWSPAGRPNVSKGMWMYTNQRRRNLRTGYGRTAWVTAPDGNTLFVPTIDFSMEGIGIDSPTELAIGEQVDVAVNIAPTGKVNMLEVRGEVRHSSAREGRYAVGIRFSAP